VKTKPGGAKVRKLSPTISKGDVERPTYDGKGKERQTKQSHYLVFAPRGRDAKIHVAHVTDRVGPAIRDRASRNRARRPLALENPFSMRCAWRRMPRRSINLAEPTFRASQHAMIRCRPSSTNPSRSMTSAPSAQ
jgi:hypothetical protein